MRRAVKRGPDNAIGRSRGGLSTKINAVVDQQGMPVRIVLSQGQSSDKTIAPILSEGLKPDRDLVADRGYDARAIIDLIQARGGRAHIPTSRDRKVQRSVDHLIYRQRNLVERFFNKRSISAVSQRATTKPLEISLLRSCLPLPGYGLGLSPRLSSGDWGPASGASRSSSLAIPKRP